MMICTSPNESLKTQFDYDLHGKGHSTNAFELSS